MLNSTETILTYGELSPIFYAAMDDGLDTSGLQSAGRILKGCEPPIICQGHFHYEVFEDNENPEFLVRVLRIKKTRILVRSTRSEALRTIQYLIPAGSEDIRMVRKF